MKNLFVLHTQYHMILTLSLIREKYTDAENHLILFRDFNISEEMTEHLKTLFTSVRIYTGSYNKEDLQWRKKIFRYSELKKQFANDDILYDNVFVVEDSVIPEQYIMKYSAKKNPNVSFGYIGDGGDAYFTNISVAKTGFAKYGFTMFLRKVIFKYFMGIGKFYSGGCFGSGEVIETCYELYPEHLRKELKGKKAHEIKGEYLIKAAGDLYSYQKRPQINGNALFIMLDKLTVYGDFKLFDEVISGVTAKAKAEGRTVYYKYHPAEKSIYHGAKDWVEIDRNISAEYILACAKPESTWVVGIMTTALQTAAKMGYQVTSYIQSFDPQREDVIELYNKIGIEVK